MRHRLSVWSGTILVLGSGFLLLTGCGPPGEKLVPVKGTVKVGSEVLTTGTVSFRPDPTENNTTASEPYGQIEPDGSYTLFTQKKPGAPVGKYIVLVTAYEPIDPKNPSATPNSLIDKKYRDPAQRLLRVEVSDSPTAGQYDLKVTK